MKTIKPVFSFFVVAHSMTREFEWFLQTSSSIIVIVPWHSLQHLKTRSCVVMRLPCVLSLRRASGALKPLLELSELITAIIGYGSGTANQKMVMKRMFTFALFTILGSLLWGNSTVCISLLFPGFLERDEALPTNNYCHFKRHRS